MNKRMIHKLSIISWTRALLVAQILMIFMSTSVCGLTFFDLSFKEIQYARFFIRERAAIEADLDQISQNPQSLSMTTQMSLWDLDVICNDFSNSPESKGERSNPFKRLHENVLLMRAALKSFDSNPSPYDAGWISLDIRGYVHSIKLELQGLFGEEDQGESVYISNFMKEKYRLSSTPYDPSLENALRAKDKAKLETLMGEKEQRSIEQLRSKLTLLEPLVFDFNQWLEAHSSMTPEAILDQTYTSTKAQLFDPVQNMTNHFFEVPFGLSLPPEVLAAWRAATSDTMPFFSVLQLDSPGMFLSTQNPVRAGVLGFEQFRAIAAYFDGLSQD